MKKLLVVMGTRPEVIKIAPVLMKLQGKSHLFKVKTVITGQHREMVKDALSIFGIKPDYDLEVMEENQQLSTLSQKIIQRLEKVLEEENPDIVLVQGDTTTSFIAALLSFYHRKITAHIEAGLRTGDRYNPFPEEINRRLISVLADLHFAPTPGAKENLLREGVPEKKIWVTGNTIVDALYHILERKKNFGNEFLKNFSFQKKRIILVTLHRRENFGEPIKNVCLALKEIVRKIPRTEIFIPVHPNPNVRKPIYSYLHQEPQIHLLTPLPYTDFIQLMAKSTLILTDSGGVQEEAPYLNKPVMVIRRFTERVEGVKKGLAILSNPEKEEIVQKVEKFFRGELLSHKIGERLTPYGDGKAAERIVKVLEDIFGKKCD